MGWVELQKRKIYSGLGWVWVIKLQTRQTQPDPPIFNKKILKPAIGHLYIYLIIKKKKKSRRAALPQFLLLILI